MIDATQISNLRKSLVNQVDGASSSSSSSSVLGAIKQAAAKTGVDFSYLLKKASTESSLNPNAKASGSSATGLFQFTRQTWLREIKDHGAEYGLGNYADHITVDNNGTAHVNDATWRQAILDLRKDPQISAEMAGELDKENFSSLQSNVGGKIGSTELYMAHFLGAGGASDFLNGMRSNPNAVAANVVPDAAASNKSVFYNADGSAKTLKQIYQHFAQKFDGTTTTQVASAAVTKSAATTALASASAHYKPAATPSINVASLADGNDASASNYTTSVTSTVKANTASSLMATMILAQMDVGNGATQGLAASGIASQQNEARKSAINILGAYS